MTLLNLGNTSLNAKELTNSINAQTIELSNDLNTVATNISNLTLGSGSGINYNLLTLSPTFENGATYGWYTAPANTNLIFDGDETTGTNTFRANSAQYSDCYLRINAGIIIPALTKIAVKMGISNFNSNKSYFEWSVGTGLGDKNVFWADFNTRSASETIITFERIIPFSWEWLQLTLVEAITWPPLAKIYSIKVWSVY